MSAETQVVEVDGLQANGVNIFVSVKQNIALAVKPNLTAGDLERWLKDVRLIDDAPMALLRIQLLIGAARAGIIMHSTDALPDEKSARALDALKAQWYGAQLWDVYRRYTVIDPN